MIYDDAWMEALRSVGDPTLDPIMLELVRGKGLDAVNQALRSAVTNEHAAPSSLPTALRTWLEQNARLPEGTDMLRLERASAFFVDHGVSISALLGLVSLPECYAARKGVKALHATDQMGYSGTEKRVSETSQFVIAVMAPGGLAPEGSGIATLMKVRMMHSASRLLIQAKDWDLEGDGVPVNQEDLIGTLTTFGCTPLVHIQKLGVKVSHEEAEDFWYFWRIAGQVLGLDPAAIPPDVAHAKAFVERLKERHWAKSNEGIELTKSLIKLYASLVPGSGLFDGIVPGVLRFLAGDVVCDILEVPKSRWKGAIEGNRVIFRMIQALQEKSTVVNDFVNTMGLKILSHEAIRIGGGKRAEFQIPGELRRAWRLPPYGSGPKTVAVVRELGEALRGKAHVLDLAVLVASADGEIDDIEVEALTEVVLSVTDARNSVEARARIKSNLRQLRESGTAVRMHTVSEALRKYKTVDDGLRLAIAMAYANSGIAKEERTLIEMLAHEMGVLPEQLDELVRTTCARIEAMPLR